jgi:hypothetical protein
MKRMLILSVALTFVLASWTNAQDAPAAPQQPPAADNPPQGGMAVVVTPPAPATQLESIQRQTGTVLVRGFTDVAGLRAEDGTSLRVLAVELTDSKGNKAVGLAIEIRPPSRSERVVLSFIDENEIDPLLAGIDALAKLDHGVTTLTNYEARYRTKGMLELANVDLSGTRFLTVTTTQVLPANAQLIWATATFPLGRARELQQQISTAKDLLARTKPTP